MYTCRLRHIYQQLDDLYQIHKCNSQKKSQIPEQNHLIVPSRFLFCYVKLDRGINYPGNGLTWIFNLYKKFTGRQMNIVYWTEVILSIWFGRNFFILYFCVLFYCFCLNKENAYVIITWELYNQTHNLWKHFCEPDVIVECCFVLIFSTLYETRHLVIFLKSLQSYIYSK